MSYYTLWTMLLLVIFKEHLVKLQERHKLTHKQSDLRLCISFPLREKELPRCLVIDIDAIINAPHILWSNVYLHIIRHDPQLPHCITATALLLTDTEILLSDQQQITSDIYYSTLFLNIYNVHVQTKSIDSNKECIKIHSTYNYIYIKYVWVLQEDGNCKVQCNGNIQIVCDKHYIKKY